MEHDVESARAERRSVHAVTLRTRDCNVFCLEKKIKSIHDQFEFVRSFDR